jgi:hypothetical protein
MTHRDNTRFYVVFLKVLISSVTLACKQIGTEARTNRTSRNYQDEIEENSSQAIEPSQPTKTPSTPPLPAKLTPLTQQKKEYRDIVWDQLNFSETRWRSMENRSQYNGIILTNINDNRTGTIGTFVPSDRAAI